MTPPAAPGPPGEAPNGRAGSRRTVPYRPGTRNVVLSPGQMELGFVFTTVPKPRRTRTTRPKIERPELPLGPLVRRPKPEKGPVWPPFEATYEDLGDDAADGDDTGGAPAS